MSRMARSGGTFRKLIWTFERGTLQYDIICILILLFIFLVPRSCLVTRRSDSMQSPRVQRGALVQADMHQCP